MKSFSVSPPQKKEEEEEEAAELPQGGESAKETGESHVKASNSLVEKSKAEEMVDMSFESLQGLISKLIIMNETVRQGRDYSILFCLCVLGLALQTQVHRQDHMLQNI